MKSVIYIGGVSVYGGISRAPQRSSPQFVPDGLRLDGLGALFVRGTWLYDKAPRLSALAEACNAATKSVTIADPGSVLKTRSASPHLA